MWRVGSVLPRLRLLSSLGNVKVLQNKPVAIIILWTVAVFGKLLSKFHAFKDWLLHFRDGRLTDCRAELNRENNEILSMAKYLTALAAALTGIGNFSIH